MNEVLTDSIHALAVRHRKAFRDEIGNPEPTRELTELQDQIKALLQDYMPHDMTKEIFDLEDLDMPGGGIDGMVIVMGSGFVLTVPI